MVDHDGRKSVLSEIVVAESMDAGFYDVEEKYSRGQSGFQGGKSLVRAPRNVGGRVPWVRRIVHQTSTRQQTTDQERYDADCLSALKLVGRWRGLHESITEMLAGLYVSGESGFSRSAHRGDTCENPHVSQKAQDMGHPIQD